MPPASLPALPALVQRKLYKTGQTRGATVREIFQNRVSRNSTVLIPLSHWRECLQQTYENGYIFLVSPEEYFERAPTIEESPADVGKNALVFYQTRADWLRWPPEHFDLQPARSRLPPLGGQYVARVPGVTASGGDGIYRGFTSSSSRGAGIRVYEYASTDTIEAVRLQLEALLWRCFDAEEELAAHGMHPGDIERRRAVILEAAGNHGLLDERQLAHNRMVDADGFTVCPLCLDYMSASAFVTTVKQAEGRERLDNRITEASLFHIEELRVGILGHRPYNVGWGHHHCNVVAKDVGVPKTIKWMREVLARNERA